MICELRIYSCGRALLVSIARSRRYTAKMTGRNIMSDDKPVNR
jgi:hypothetical protein